VADLSPTNIAAKTCPWLWHPLSVLRGPKRRNQLSGKSLALREFSDIRDLAKSSLFHPVTGFSLSRSHCGHVRGVMPGDLPYVKVSGCYVSQRDSLLSDKTWSHLGLSGCRCWINHTSRDV